MGDRRRKLEKRKNLMTTKSFNGAEVGMSSNTRNRSFRVEIWTHSTHRLSTPPPIICSDEKGEYIKNVWHWKNKYTLIYERIVTCMNLLIYPGRYFQTEYDVC